MYERFQKKIYYQRTFLMSWRWLYELARTKGDFLFYSYFEFIYKKVQGRKTSNYHLLYSDVLHNILLKWFHLNLPQICMLSYFLSISSEFVKQNAASKWHSWNSNLIKSQNLHFLFHNKTYLSKYSIQHTHTLLISSLEILL